VVVASRGPQRPAVLYAPVGVYPTLLPECKHLFTERGCLHSPRSAGTGNDLLTVAEDGGAFQVLLRRS